MKASEILRDLAQLLDTIDGKEQKESTPTKPSPLIVPVKLEPEANTSNHKSEEGDRADPEETMFVPPLQAKIELLKKSVGVPNHYAEEGDVDELSIIKKAAGLVAARQVASDDEPLDN